MSSTAATGVPPATRVSRGPDETGADNDPDDRSDDDSNDRIAHPASPRPCPPIVSVWRRL